MLISRTQFNVWLTHLLFADASVVRWFQWTALISPLVTRKQWMAGFTSVDLQYTWRPLRTPDFAMDPCMMKPLFHYLQNSLYKPYPIALSHPQVICKTVTESIVFMPSLSLCYFSVLCICFLLMASSVDPLVVGRVIGDVVDMFVPTVHMSVYYGSKHVTNGCDIKPSMSQLPPKVTISGISDELYTLVMTDPDAPSPSEPTMREWIHWIVSDIPGGTNPQRGNEILPYMGPRPPVGIHRYILVLFKQKGPLGLVEQPPSRAGFNTRYFSQRLDLGLPVATVYFNSQKEPANRRR